MQERAISLLLYADVPLGERFSDKVVEALRAYADKVEEGWQGNRSIEFFTAPNGCQIAVIAGSNKFRGEYGT